MSPQATEKAREYRREKPEWLEGKEMVGGTRIELVTPTMST
jgi:hypothetical protein